MTTTTTSEKIKTDYSKLFNEKWCAREVQNDREKLINWESSDGREKPSVMLEIEGLMEVLQLNIGYVDQQNLPHRAAVIYQLEMSENNDIIDGWIETNAGNYPSLILWYREAQDVRKGMLEIIKAH